MIKEYWARVRVRAWSNTTEAFSINTWQRAMTKILVGALAIGFVGYFLGGPDALSKLKVALMTLGAFSVGFILFYSWNFFTVPAQLDTDETKRRVGLEEKIASLKANRPRLKLTINRTSGFQNNGTYNILIIATVTNTGPYPSIFGHFRLLLNHQGEDHVGRSFAPEKLFTPNFPGGVTEVHRQEEHLGLKGANPVPMGSMTQGFLLCEFPTLPVSAMIDRCELTIAITDILGNEECAMVPVGGSRMDPPQVFPGVKIEIKRDT